MEELNKSTLQTAIASLPTYEAPADCWSLIASALAEEAHLEQAIGQLPVYEAPGFVWEKLETGLGTLPRSTRLRTTGMRWFWMAAAVLTIVFGAWWLIAERPFSADQLTVRQEILNQTLRAPLEEQDDEAFQLIEQLCASRAPLCEQSAFKQLRMELEELNTAKSDLKTVLGAYGDDPGLTGQLVRIERERSEVLRQMISMI